MSLLDRGNEDVVVFPQETVTSADGNTVTRPSTTGIPTTARIEVRNQSGTSSRRSEQDNEGFESEEVYSLKFTRAFDAQYGVLGPQSQIEWREARWALFGFPSIYNRSKNTAHLTYTIKRY